MKMKLFTKKDPDRYALRINNDTLDAVADSQWKKYKLVDQFLASYNGSNDLKAKDVALDAYIRQKFPKKFKRKL